MGHFDIPKELVRQLQKKELDMLLYFDQFLYRARLDLLPLRWLLHWDCT